MCMINSSPCATVYMTVKREDIACGSLLRGSMWRVFSLEILYRLRQKTKKDTSFFLVCYTRWHRVHYYWLEWWLCIIDTEPYPEQIMMTSSDGNIFRVTGTLWGSPAVTGGLPSQRPVMRCFDVLFDLHLNKRLSKQSKRRWFETPSRSLWRHCNVEISSMKTTETHPNVI